MLLLLLRSSTPLLTTFDPSNKGPTTTLSNGNLTAATSTQAVQSTVRSTIARSGLRWAEFLVGGTGGNAGIGLVSATAAVTGAYTLGYTDANGVGIYADTGFGSGGASFSGTSPGFATGDIINVLSDTDNDTITFYKNGVVCITVTGLDLGTAPYLAVDTFDGDRTITLRAGSVPLTYPAPPGAATWDQDLTQVLGNPTFETDTVWSKGTFSSSPVTISGGFVHSGASGATSIVGQSALTPGVTYNFRFDYKVGFQPGSGRLRLDNSNDTATNIVFTSDLLVGDGAWHSVTGTFTATDSWLWLQASAAVFDGSGVIDNFTAIPASAAVRRLLTRYAYFLR